MKKEYKRRGEKEATRGEKNERMNEEETGGQKEL